MKLPHLPLLLGLTLALALPLHAHTESLRTPYKAADSLKPGRHLQQRISTKVLRDRSQYDMLKHRFNQVVRINLTEHAASSSQLPSGVTLKSDAGAVSIYSTLKGVEYVITGTYLGTINISSKYPAKVTLHNAHIKPREGVALNLVMPKGFVYTHRGSLSTIETTVPAVAESAIYCTGTLFLEGRGEVHITAHKGDGLKALAGIIANGGEYEIRTDRDAFRVKDDDIVVNGGYYDIESPAVALHALTGSARADGMSADLVVNGGSFTIRALGAGGTAMQADGDMVLNGGSYTIDAQQADFRASGDIVLNGGSYLLGARQGHSLDVGGDLVINGGTIYLNSPHSSAIEAGGDMSITSGVITISAETPQAYHIGGDTMHLGGHFLHKGHKL